MYELHHDRKVMLALQATVHDQKNMCRAHKYRHLCNPMHGCTRTHITVFLTTAEPHLPASSEKIHSRNPTQAMSSMLLPEAMSSSWSSNSASMLGSFSASAKLLSCKSGTALSTFLRPCQEAAWVMTLQYQGNSPLALWCKSS